MKIPSLDRVTMECLLPAWLVAVSTISLCTGFSFCTAIGELIIGSGISLLIGLVGEEFSGEGTCLRGDGDVFRNSCVPGEVFCVGIMK